MFIFLKAFPFYYLMIAAVASLQVSHAGYKLYHVRPETRAQLELIGAQQELDFWSQPRLSRWSSVMVSPNEEDSFLAFLRLHNITYELLNHDVQSLIRKERVEQQQKLRRKRDTNGRHKSVQFDHFWELEEIYEYLDYLAKLYPDKVRVKNYGTTYEGRPIKVITVSNKGEVKQNRPIVLIDGGIHAREWAGHMSVVYLIHQLVESSSANTNLLNNTDWVIMPVANPDGYVYTHRTNRLWRKNRAPANTLCQGVDLNRNFPFRWSFNGGECSNGYAGSTPASELETRALMLLMASYATATKVYLAVHSCGDYILYPYGYDYVLAANAAELQELGEKAARAVEAIGGPKYGVGSASFLVYPANGSDDFMYGSVGVNFSFTLELSCGAFGDGFIIDSNETQKITKEAFEMFKVFGVFAGSQVIEDTSCIWCVRKHASSWESYAI
ncbi:carboxypeptidase B-like isoform X1 [Wyeomyia smithii]|uniref:carboxypeptidase B-like isoform X1 n=1 Tax=Wyeomyia smithii TaxID=174621 RepID=UPI002467ECFC|nr:carboxypeptidase B-like isoform X1 [Wyeomyia smithii]